MAELVLHARLEIDFVFKLQHLFVAVKVTIFLQLISFPSLIFLSADGQLLRVFVLLTFFAIRFAA